MFRALVSDNLVGSPPSLHSVCISSLSKLNFWSQLVHSKELDMVAVERDRQDTLGAAQIELFTVLTQNIQRIYILDISIRLNHQFPLSPHPVSMSHFKRKSNFRLLCPHTKFNEELACKARKMRLHSNDRFAPWNFQDTFIDGQATNLFVSRVCFVFTGSGREVE